MIRWNRQSDESCISCKRPREEPMTNQEPGAPEPLTSEEERAIRDRDAAWHENANGSFTAYTVDPQADMSDHTEAAFRDRRRLLATLDRERRERVDPDLLRLIELIGDRDIYVRSPEGLTTRIRFGKGEPDVPLDSRTGLPLGHGHFATSESVGGLIDRLNLIAPGMVTIHEGAAADIPKGERLGSLTPAERKGRGRGWRLRAPL